MLKPDVLVKYLSPFGRFLISGRQRLRKGCDRNIYPKTPSNISLSLPPIPRLCLLYLILLVYTRYHLFPKTHGYGRLTIIDAVRSEEVKPSKLDPTPLTQH